MHPNQLSALVRGYLEQAGVAKPGACHLFRHTSATLMLEAGADVRYIQAMLGHVSLATTQIYTHVSIQKLREVHEKTHPARLYRTPADPDKRRDVEDGERAPEHDNEQHAPDHDNQRRAAGDDDERRAADHDRDEPHAPDGHDDDPDAAPCGAKI
jgi:hypothetical protein